jgi:hypothetical protein
MRPLFAVLCLLAWCWHADPCFAREAGEPASITVWTAIIPDAFPRYVYTWRMKGDGTYREDGRDAATGTPIQPTLSGHWNSEAPRMVLRQQDQPFVFDGVVLGSLYTGTLYFNGRAVSRFCAARGDEAPQRCDTQPGVATTGTQAPSPPHDIAQSGQPPPAVRGWHHVKTHSRQG